MEDTAHRAIAIVGAGAILPDAPNVAAFWHNVRTGRYSITEVARDRWDPSLYYDPDPTTPDKTYSKIGGWVRDQVWDPMKWHLPIPPKVSDAMDPAQKWAIAATREALEDYGYPKRPLDPDRVAVILGNAMAGEKHYLTAMRVHFPEYARELAEIGSFAALPEAIRNEITGELHDRIGKRLPEITEDSMPGELANCIAGRIANIYNFHGPNFVCDAACASAMAAISAAAQGLIENNFDAVVTGGIDRNMGVHTFVKFCKIGALSATGTRPYAEGADGFVMGEGAGIFLLKRLADAEHDGDKIYAVLRGIGASSDGKGKGITAPNPVGQKFCLERAWQNAGLSPATATLIEGHGTSTRVGDVVEAHCMTDLLSSHHLSPHSVALGSVKSNIGHLKGAAGAAGLLKTMLALRDKVLPPSVHCEHPSPDIDFSHSPLYVNTELKEWTAPAETPRRAGVSAFGFGGTNFHIVLEEHIPHRLTGNGRRSVAVSLPPETSINEVVMNAKKTFAAPELPGSASSSLSNCKSPLRGALVIGALSEAALVERLHAVIKDAENGCFPPPAAPAESDLRAPERLAIDYADAGDLIEKSTKALKAFAAKQAIAWKALRAQGIFRGQGPAPKVAFLYTGQGSQYANMLRTLYTTEPIVAETFAQADRVMTPLLGKPLTDFVFVDETDSAAVAKADDDLRQTAITQPAVLAIDLALTRLLAAYGVVPDFTMGHSLGEYGALVASGALPFEDALEAVSARGRGMTRFAVADKGRMAAVFAPLNEIDRMLKAVDGYVVIANINSDHQAVIGGASNAVTQAIELFRKAGYEVAELPVSHAFHTSIVAAASEPLRHELERLRLQSPRLPIVTNVNGEFYPTGPGVVPAMLDLLAKQVASPVQFVKGLHALYDAGARIFVEVGPKKALQGFAEDVLAPRGDVVTLFTNHPKFGDILSFNQALCGLYAAGLGRGMAAVSADRASSFTPAPSPSELSKPVAMNASTPHTSALPVQHANDNHYAELGHFFADVLDRGWQMHRGENRAPAAASVVITGAALGLPGTAHIFDDENIARILRGDQFIDLIPTRFRRAMLDKHITRLVKSDNGGATFETIHNMAEVIKLAGRGGTFDLENEFGISADRSAALDRASQLAIAAGIDALRDAGIPLVMRYKTTSKGTQLPDRWALPDSLRDATGVIFASAFPGYDSFADEMARYYADHSRREQLGLLDKLLARAVKSNGDSALEQEIERQLEDLRDTIEKEPYVFDRRFLLKTLSMGHSQFAEFIGARGPNTQINSACASTTQAVALAEDWIHAGRCARVIVISADDVTSDHLMEWMGAGFLASGAAATDEVVEEAATPFDRRRHGLIVGMGAAALVIESAGAARERGLQPICEVLGTVTANSAFHGTRLDVEHIGQMMENLISRVELSSGISRYQIAAHTVFVSHETYTPARGGSASAEVNALRRVFGGAADQIVIANTKGMTGHAMATGLEDVLAVKALETSLVPPVVNFKEVDPELGTLNLSKGGAYPVEYALRLAAGFGSQISMALLRWVATSDKSHRRPNALGYGYRIFDENIWKNWLSQVAGHPAASLEIVRRTLRVPDHNGAPRFTDVGQQELLKPTAVGQHSPAATFAAPPGVAPSATVENRVEQKSAAKPLVSEPVAIKAAPENDPVKERGLALVAEKTGYPVDMLDLDLDLEADLGVDTVKQAEVLATIREAYGITRDDKIKLREFPTLAHVIRFVYDRRPELRGAQTRVSPLGPPPTVPSKPTTARNEEVEAKAKPAEAGAPSADSLDGNHDPVKDRILTLMVEKTGYPQDMLDLDLDLEADLGVDTVKQAEMFAAIREIYNIPRDENRKLRDYPTLAHVIRFVYEKRPDLAGTPAKTPASPVLPTPSITASEPVAFCPTPAPPQQGDDPIQKTVLKIMAEKTGYPEDMLDLDLDLEADLGVDTVKQAEMFAAVRAAYNIPRDENLKLRDFPTLAHVIKFAHDRSRHTTSTFDQTTAEMSPASRLQPAAPIAASLDVTNRIPRRVPAPALRPPLALFKSTGVKLERGSRVIVMPDHGGVADALTKRLQAMDVEVLSIEGAPDVEMLTTLLKNWLAAGDIQGIYWLPALDEEGTLRELDLASWHEGLRVRVKSLYATMRTLYEQVGRPGTFLLAATRLGGQHGYDEAGAVAPLGGAVVGFVKTYKRERSDALVKALDFESNRDANEVAGLLIEETNLDPGAVEIGYTGERRWTVDLEENPANDGQPGMVLDKNSIFLITGAAGSIVSAITADLAAASGGTFYLLDLAPKPDPESPDLKRFITDKENLKRDLFARIQERGERATPALVEKELANLERAQAAQTAIDAVHAAGGTAHYFSVNLSDAPAVATVIADVRRQSGRIDVLLHAAGVERSHPLPDKDPKEFDLVFDVKSDGFFNLLHAIGDMPLAASVVFSSIAARFGNAGQTDYSSANDLLCKITSSFRTNRPATRGIAIDWTAWGGMGMATRGSIPKMMELAGIDMLPPEVGVPIVRRELTTGATRGEIVIGQRLGVLLNEWDATGVLDASEATSAWNSSHSPGPLAGKIASVNYDGYSIESSLDPAVQPFLRDHKIDGTAVLPAVMGIEAFAEAARCFLPAWQVESIEDVNFLAPFKFYRDEPRDLRVETRIHPAAGRLLADCRLIGSRVLPNQAEVQRTTHFTARVRLANHPIQPPASRAFVAPSGRCVESADIYLLYFHGPAYQVMEKAWFDGKRVIGLLAKGLPPNHHPSELLTVMAPRLIELCFQTAGLWELAMQGRMGLPRQVREVSVFQPSNAASNRLYAVVSPDPAQGTFDAEVLDSEGNCYLRLNGYQTVTLANAIDPVSLKPLQAIFSEESTLVA
jgi:acyl transferase domain-containing protein/NAD(P)-dependent dehydrogenase (short-subunit alcohol dehydrogenase family)/acyl carrier protein